MPDPRVALVLIGLTFGTWESVDIFRIEVPEVAALFAVLFLGCTAWFLRRDSVRPVVIMTVLFCIEAGSAPSWHVMTITKVVAITLGVVGIASAARVLVKRRRSRSSQVIPA